MSPAKQGGILPLLRGPQTRGAACSAHIHGTNWRVFPTLTAGMTQLNPPSHLTSPPHLRPATTRVRGSGSGQRPRAQPRSASPIPPLPRDEGGAGRGGGGGRRGGGGAGAGRGRGGGGAGRGSGRGGARPAACVCPGDLAAPGQTRAGSDIGPEQLRQRRGPWKQQEGRGV